MRVIAYSKEHPEFLTVTCLEWKHVLADDRFKRIITESLSFLNKANRVSIYAFVIMSNHFHLVWQILGDHKRDAVQRDFLKYTGQQIKLELQKDNPELLEKCRVNKPDRKYQIWKRESLSIELFTPTVFYQKLEYVHYNPVVAGICEYPEEYYYSSANFYKNSTDPFNMVTHFIG